MDLKHLFFKLVLTTVVLMTGRTVFDCGTTAKAEMPEPPPDFKRVLILFPAEAGPGAREAFMAGLEEARARREAEYREIMRKWHEAAPEREQKRKELEAELVARYGENWSEKLEDGDQRLLADEKQNLRPSFLYFPDVLNVPLEEQPGVGERKFDLGKMEFPYNEWDEGFGAVVVVASDEIASELARLIRSGNPVKSLPLRNPADGSDLTVVFAGTSSFDESLRRETVPAGSGLDTVVEHNIFAIIHPDDPWPNIDLALRTFPQTRKVILLTSAKIWDDDKETACRAKLGPGKTLKTILLPGAASSGKMNGDRSLILRQQYTSLAEGPGEEIDAFRAAVEAEMQPDTVIVSMSSFEWGLDPVEWLPAAFDACPIFADTPPQRKNAVGGFCRSMKKLSAQVGDLLEELGKAPLETSRKGIPTTIAEDDDLWLNEAALKRYKLNVTDFPVNAILANTTTRKAPQVRVYKTWTRKRVLLVLAVNGAVLFGLAVFTLLSARARRRRRMLSEKVYDSLPARVLVTDREGRIIDYHMQFGEVEQKGELLWKNINEVPWLRDIGMDQAVREAFDSGKTVVREFVVDGERRVVVLSPVPSDVFGRAAVIALSSDLPGGKSPA